MSYTDRPISLENQSFNYYGYVEKRAHEYIPKEFGRLLAKL